MGRNNNNTPKTGPVKYFRGMAIYFNGKNNNRDIATVFTLIAYYSLYNEKLQKSKVYINGKYYTRLTLSTVVTELDNIISKSAVKRILETLVESGVVECLEPDDDEAFALGKYYRISELGFSIIKDEYYWLENDVDYAIGKKGIISSDNNQTSLSDPQNNVVWK